MVLVLIRLLQYLLTSVMYRSHIFQFLITFFLQTLIIFRARINPATGIFHALDMTCPDGTIESIDLSDLGSKDKAWLERNLPNFCRQNCDSIYS